MPLPPRQASRTLLLVGEGETEVAFLKHVKGIYAPRGCGLAVKVISARGMGPENVVETVVRHSAYRGYELRAALLDTDIPWTEEVRQRAIVERITLIGSVPCLEGLLLNVLGREIPRRSLECKRTLRSAFQGDPLRADAYARQFSRQVLEAARIRVDALRQLLEIFT